MSNVSPDQKFEHLAREVQARAGGAGDLSAEGEATARMEQPRWGGPGGGVGKREGPGQRQEGRVRSSGRQCPRNRITKQAPLRGLGHSKDVRRPMIPFPANRQERSNRRGEKRAQHPGHTPLPGSERRTPSIRPSAVKGFVMCSTAPSSLLRPLYTPSVPPVRMITGISRVFGLPRRRVRAVYPSSLASCRRGSRARVNTRSPTRPPAPRLRPPESGSRAARASGG